MPWTEYSSNDVSAPTLTGLDGSFNTVIHKVLVEGYGSKAAAGWVLVEATPSKDQLVLKPGPDAAFEFVLHIDNTHVAVPTKAVPIFRLYESEANYVAQINPTPADGTNVTVLASAVVDSTPRAWRIYADDRTAIILIANGEGSNTDKWATLYVGEFFSYLEGDACPVCLMGAEKNSYFFATIKGNNWTISGTESANWPGGHYLMRSYDGAHVPVPFYPLVPHPFIPSTTNQYAANGTGFWDTTNPAGSTLFMLAFVIGSLAPEPNMRGELRGVKWLTAQDYVDGDTLDDGEGNPWVVRKTRGKDYSDASTEYWSMLTIALHDPPTN